MPNFWKHFREFLVPLGMAGIFAALVYFGVIRITGENREKMIAIQQSAVDRKMFEEQSNGISGMREEEEHIRATDGRLDVFLSKDSIISLVETLESIGKDSRVSVVSEAATAPPPAKKVAPKNVAPEDDDESTKEKKGVEKKQKELLVSLLPGDRSIFITFKATGEYGDVLAFLRRLDTMPVMLDVFSVEISPAPNKEGEFSSPVFDPSISPSPFSPTSASPETVASPKKPNQVLASFTTVIYITH